MKNEWLKKNNQGSSLIMVLIIVSFIAILATVSIMTAMLNLKMKTVDRESKKTFYTAEEAIDEIYAGLGMLSMKKLDAAYQEQLSTIIQNTSVNHIRVSSNVDNISANLELRKKFTGSMLLTLLKQPDTAVGVWNPDAQEFPISGEADKNAFMESLNGLVEDASKAKVVSLKDIKIKKTQEGGTLPVYTILFEGCHVRYVKDRDGYYADVTFNGSIALPDIVVQFTPEGKNVLDTFKEYSLIGNQGVKINENKELKLSNKLYAGGEGLNLAAGSTLNAANSTIVSKGDINLSAAKFQADKTSIWANNLLADTTGASEISLGEESSTYLKDDLTLDGPRSRASIQGDYYGYSYEGTGNPSGHNASSSIIVNGENATLDMGEIKTLVLGGRAYIDYGTADSYMTGESLALKGNQEIYLVPPSYIHKKGSNQSLSNPFNRSEGENVQVTMDENNFFASALLDTQTPYIAVNNGSETYLYWKFKTKQDSARYTRAILEDKVFDELCEGIEKGTPIYKAYEDSRNYMKNLLQMNMAQLVQTSIVSKPDKNAKIYANGAMIQADPATKSVSGIEEKPYQLGDSYNEDAFALNALDLKNRYLLISKMLYSPSLYQMNGSEIVKDAAGNPVRNLYTDITNSILDNGNVIDIRGFGESVFDNFINVSYLNANTSFSQKIGENIIYATTAENLTLAPSQPNDAAGGVIIAKGNVQVKRDFNGIIIAGGRITIDENVEVKNQITGYKDLIEFLDQCPEKFKKYFKYWNPIVTETEAGSKSITSISGITYKDIVSFDGWVKGAEND